LVVADLLLLQGKCFFTAEHTLVTLGESEHLDLSNRNVFLKGWSSLACDKLLMTLGKARCGIGRLLSLGVDTAGQCYIFIVA
jgi:hypothetical protein